MMESFVTIEIEGLADDFTWNIGEYQFLVRVRQRLDVEEFGYKTSHTFVEWKATYWKI